MILSKFYKHIDNGGIRISVETNDSDECQHMLIRMSTSYFGYPDIESVLNLTSWTHNSSEAKELLRNIGQMFIEASEKSNDTR